MSSMKGNYTQDVLACFHTVMELNKNNNTHYIADVVHKGRWSSRVSKNEKKNLGYNTMTHKKTSKMWISSCVSRDKSFELLMFITKEPIEIVNVCKTDSPKRHSYTIKTCNDD